jgi:hypothetical protein
MPPLHDAGTKAVQLGEILIPVSSELAARAAVEGETVRLSWHGHEPESTRVFYRILRSSAAADTACGGRRNAAADDCRLYSDSVAATRGTTFVDRPGAGTWTYRIGVAANWLDDERYGDVYVVGPPIRVSVR